LSSGSLRVLVSSNISRLVQASLWLSDVRLMKYDRASLHTLTHTEYTHCQYNTH